MGTMTRFLIGTVLICLLILIWVLAVQVGQQLADGLRTILP